MQLIMLFLNDWLFNSPGNVCMEPGGLHHIPRTPREDRQQSHAGQRQGVRCPGALRGDWRQAHARPVQRAPQVHSVPATASAPHSPPLLRRPWGCWPAAMPRAGGHREAWVFGPRSGYLAQDLGVCPGSNPAPPNDRAPLSSRFLKLPPERMAGRLPAPPAALADGKSARWDSREAERSEAHIGWLLGKQACGVGKDI